MTITGSCLCGNVRFEILSEPHKFYLCHCTRCQKITGSAYAANMFSDADSVRWLAGAEFVTSYELSDTSFFNSCFCQVCGSPVPRLAKSGNFMIIPAGCLNEAPAAKPQESIFWYDRASWYLDACDTLKRKGYE